MYAISGAARVFLLVPVSWFLLSWAYLDFQEWVAPPSKLCVLFH